jgi:hypothetical protein
MHTLAQANSTILRRRVGRIPWRREACKKMLLRHRPACMRARPGTPQVLRTPTRRSFGAGTLRCPGSRSLPRTCSLFVRTEAANAPRCQGALRHTHPMRPFGTCCTADCVVSCGLFRLCNLREECFWPNITYCMRK